MMIIKYFHPRWFPDNRGTVMGIVIGGYGIRDLPYRTSTKKIEFWFPLPFVRTICVSANWGYSADCWALAVAMLSPGRVWRLIHLAAGVDVDSQTGVFGSVQPGYDGLMNPRYDKKWFIERTLVIIIHFISETQQHLAYFNYLQFNHEILHHPFSRLRISTSQLETCDINRREWKRLKGFVFSPPSVRPVPQEEGRRVNATLQSLPFPPR